VVLSLIYYALPEWVRRLAELLEVDAPELTRELLQVVFIWLFCYGGIRAVRLVARRIELAVDDKDDTRLSEREQRGKTISQLLRSVSRVVFIALGILLSLNVFIDIGPLLAGAGILGLAVSFGAQSLVKDVISGFFYLVEGQFAVGDVIEVAGKSGVVEQMTLRMVVLRDLRGSVHMIPNGQITTVSNMTRKWARAVIDVGVAYGTRVDEAIRVIEDEARLFAADPVWHSRFDGPPEVAGVEELAENQVTVRVLLRTSAGQQWAAGREFRRRVKNRLDREGIEIPFPQRTVYLRTDESARRADSEAASPPSADTLAPRPPRESRVVPPESANS
jgi:small conductance mechanosensitive channel